MIKRKRWALGLLTACLLLCGLFLVPLARPAATAQAAETEVSYRGDVNGDGAADLEDAILMQQYLMGAVTLTKYQIEVGDVNGDGKITLEDTIMLCQHVIGIDTGTVGEVYCVHELVHHEGKAPTCGSVGWEAYNECAKCDYSTYEEIAKLAHDYESEMIKAPTCTEAGERRYTCAVCGDSYTLSITAWDHSYASEVTKEATCTEAGVITYTCSRCNESFTETVDALGHDYKCEVTPPTCTQAGEQKFTCSTCGDTYSITTTASHHYELVETVAAGCTEAGYQLFRCSVCYEEYRIVIPAEAGHNYVGEVTLAPTAEREGEMIYTCTQCDNSYTVTLSKLNTDGGYVLLIQDRLPWSTDSNAELLNELTEDQQIAGWEIVTSAEAASVDFDDYDIIYIANDQTTETYNRLGALNGKLTQYVEDGGVLIYGACDQGWGSGKITYELPGGVSISTSFSRYNYIADDAHDIVTGELTGGGGLTNGLLYSTDTSHTIFDDLPEGSNVILQDANGDPTLVEYTLGKGFVVASGLTWEYTYKHEFMYSTSFAKESYDDLFAYAVKLANTCKHEYQATKTVEPTCTKGGYTVYTCTLCGRSYRGDFVDAKGHTEVTIPGKEATCIEAGLTEGIYCSVCGEVLKEQEVIPLKEHTVVIDEAVEATCTQTGLTEGSHCSVCEAVIVAQEVVPAKEHNYKSEVTKQPTCTAAGERTYTCTVCGDSYTEEISTVAHTYGEGVVTKQPTCSEAGERKFTCAVCGDSYTETVRALGHSYVSHEGKESTCTEVGWKAYQTCSRCDYTTYEEIDALGHDYECRTIKQPTCTEAGEYIYTCSRCDDSYTEPIDAPGHKLTHVEATEPTCEEDGNIEYYYCSRCKKYFKDAQATEELESVIIPATGHTEGDPVHENEKDATCEEAASYEEVVYCTACGKELSRETVEVGDPLGHDYVQHEGKAATCTEAGWEAYQTCSRCDYTTYEEIAPLGHQLTHFEAVEPTCGKDGNIEYWTCSRCKKYFADKDATKELTEGELTIAATGDHTPGEAVRENEKAATCEEDGSYDEVVYCEVCGKELSREEKVIKAYGHDWQVLEVTKQPTCTAPGEENVKCSRCDETSTRSIDPLGHEIVQHEGKAATCTEAGWKAYETCTRCDYTTYEALSELGHDIIEHEGQKATCMQIGWEPYETCTRCDYSTHEEIEKLDHSFTKYVSNEDATCTEDGTETAYCDYDCGTKDTRTIEGSATGHTGGEPERENEKAATCEKAASHDEVVYCTVCSKELSRETVEVGAPLGHDYVQHEGKAATCTEAGWEAYQTCTRCDYTTYEAINALGHELEYVAAADPTCEEDGCIEHWYCSRCGKYFAGEDAQKELTEDEVIIPATEHDPNFAVQKNVIEPTCEEDGSHDDVVYCKVCKKELSREHVVDPALGHDWSKFSYNGTEHWRECSRCGEMKDVGAHTYSERPIDGYLASEATCTAKAVYYKSCSVCGMAGTETFEYGELLPHTPGPEATCTTPQTCTVCGAVIKEALGHSFTKYFSDGNATCEEDGTETAKCDRCDATDTRTDEDSAKGHNWESHYTSNDDAHWIACSRCDAKDKLGEHTFENGICTVCNMVDPDAAVSSEGLEFTLSDDGTYYSVTDYKGSATEVYIPSIYNDLPVTEIGEQAFYNCTSFESVTIGDGIATIERNAFGFCTNLTSITIPDSVTSIVLASFSDCESLTNVYITNIAAWCSIEFTDFSANPLLYAHNLYLNGKLVTDLLIPEGVKKIGDYAFYNFASLTSITIPDSVTSIGYEAFYGCKSLTSIKISDSVTSIGYSAFNNCENVKALFLGSGIKQLGNFCFSNLSKLETIYYNIACYDDFSYWGSCVFGGSGVSSRGITLTIGKDVERIPAYLFDWSRNSVPYSTKLISVIFEEGGKCSSIGAGAFYSTFITSIIIPETITSIEDDAFGDCHKLLEVYNLSSLSITKGSSSHGSVAYNALNVYTSLEEESRFEETNDGYLFYHTDENTYYLVSYLSESTDLTLPESIHGYGYSIYDYAFSFIDHSSVDRYNLNPLKSVVITSGVLAIGDFAFYDCSSLTSITIGNDIAEIGTMAFFNCKSLASAIFENPSGWKIGILDLSAEELSNSSTAVEYLRDTYNGYTWTRE